MKLHKSQTGFTALHILLLLVILGIIGFAGWKVYDASKSVNPTASPTPVTLVQKPAEPKVPDGFVAYENKELGFKVVYPKEWGEVKLRDISKFYGAPNTEYGYKIPLLGLGFTKLKEYDGLTVWNKNSISIATSANAPSYCTFDEQTKKWKPTNSSFGTTERCNMGTRNVGTTKIYQFTSGALGAYSFKEVFAFGDKFLEFSSHAATTEDFNEFDTGPDLKDGVDTRIQKFVQSSVDKLVNANSNQ